MQRNPPLDLFDPIETSTFTEVIELWQYAFEWSYYDSVLESLEISRHRIASRGSLSSSVARAFSFLKQKLLLHPPIWRKYPPFRLYSASISNKIRLAELHFYGGDISAAYLTGMYTLICIRSIDNDVSLARYHVYVHTHKGSALMFLISAIAIIGFPTTTAFIGIDVLFTYLQADQILPAALMACCFIFLELVSVRIFLRIFLGPDKKMYHPVA